MKKNRVPFKKTDLLVLSFIIIVAFVFRLYKINTPLADLHSWRQVDTAAVARNFVKIKFDIFSPRYDDLSSLQSMNGQDNPQGYRFVELPLYNAIFALLYKYIPSLPLEVWGRLTSVFFSLIIIAVIYYLCLKESSRLTAIIAALVYAVFPFFVFFSRTVLPETMALSLAFMAILFMYFFTAEKTNFKSGLLFTMSVICFSLSMLVKPTTIFFTLTILYLFYRKYGLSLFKKVHFYLYFLFIGAPVYLWREYIKAFPEGIPPNAWLITNVNTYEGLKNIFFKPAFFRWIFYERIANIIFGGYLVFFAVLGIIAKQKKLLLHSIIFSSLAYLLVFQGGNVQHEYYQTLILPALAIAVGLGTSFVIDNLKLFLHPVLTIMIILMIYGLSFFFSFYRVREFYKYPEDLVQIAKVIKTLTKEGDKIITDRLGDTTLLYLSERRGAPALYRELPELQKIGYKYFVTQTKDTVISIKSRFEYPVVFENDQFTIFELL